MGQSSELESSLVIVSADCHAGAPILGYRDYLAREWHDEFDAWAATYKNPFEDLEHASASRNWDSALRLADLEEDGIAAEVIFPNTVPPFYPSSGSVASPPSRQDYARRWAGLQAHNRWLVDFCNDAPGRRAGIAQLMFNEPKDAVSELTWAREHGLFGGVLLPSIPPGAPIPPIWDESYEPIWDACEDLDIPVNNHGGGGVPDYGFGPGMPRVLYLTEFTFYSNRNVWHLIWSGVFERHPSLRYVMTEQGMAEILNQAPIQDYFYAMLLGEGDSTKAQGARELVGDYAQTALSMRPSDYFRRNCWIGASFMGPTEAARRHEIGVNRVMWGADYPHREQTWPNSRDSITEAVSEVPADEARQMLGLNAAEFYGFDLRRLEEVASRIGPSADQLLSSVAV
jgi:predicted TIM-barrel fold metal-dependent hydrolase